MAWTAQRRRRDLKCEAAENSGMEATTANRPYLAGHSRLTSSYFQQHLLSQPATLRLQFPFPFPTYILPPPPPPPSSPVYISLPAPPLLLRPAPLNSSSLATPHSVCRNATIRPPSAAQTPLLRIPPCPAERPPNQSPLGSNILVRVFHLRIHLGVFTACPPSLRRMSNAKVCVSFLAIPGSHLTRI